MRQNLLKHVLPAVLCLLLAACGGQAKVMNDKLGEEMEENSQQKNDLGNEVTLVEPKITETDLSAYFGEHKGSAVFYTAGDNTYEIYNLADAQAQRSPCSTFKIVSTLAALEYEVITDEDSVRKWSGETFWNDAWNTDISLKEAFQTSCVWYYRKIINEIGQEKMQAFLDELEYGNADISDWDGKLNENNQNRSLTGFWIESSLKISPLEQVNMLSRVFGEQSSYRSENVQLLKNTMKVEQNQTNISIYGKTGYGKLKNISLDSWFVGMFEQHSTPIYFAVHLSESEDPNVSSALAKEIAIQIITGAYGD